MPSSPSFSCSAFITAQHCRIFQNISMSLAKVFEAVKSPLDKGRVLKKQVNIFWKDNFYLSFPYSLFLLLSTSFYCRTCTNSNFTFLPSGPYIDLSIDRCGMQNGLLIIMATQVLISAPDEESILQTLVECVFHQQRSFVSVT